MEKNIYKLNLSIFDLDIEHCERKVLKFINKIENNSNEQNFIIELHKNNTNSVQNIINITNVILFAKKLSAYKKKITKIIVYSSDGNDLLFKNIIKIVKNILGYDIEQILEFVN